MVSQFMWARVVLALLFVLMVWGAVHFQPARPRTLLATKGTDGPRLRLMTWNIGYAELENDTRAQTRDLPSVAQTILSQDPDVVALQELTNQEQLKLLLGQLRGRYRGAIAPLGNADRAEAVLVKGSSARFENVPAGQHFAVAGIFRPRDNVPEVAVISAHADAFSAARRRSFTGDVVDWTLKQPGDQVIFVAGDFNFEIADSDRTNLYTDNLKHDSESYSYLLRYFKDLGRDAGDTAINDRRIDYIFGPREKALLRRAEVLRGAAVGRMDHWPVLVEIAF
jgi:endonuclease/exonuclease/phosphatase family metal-dependent hydrolase